MAKKQREEKPARRSGPLRYAAGMTGALLAALGALLLFQKTEQFLIADSRFVFAAPSDPGEDSPCLSLEGLEYASRERVVKVFARDFGRSISLIPLAERRRNLLTIDWVKEATILRTWPNHVRVSIEERKPVAFARLSSPRGQPINRAALIDEDGVLLDVRGPGSFKLPVLSGVRLEQREPDRRLRVRRMQRLLRELGERREMVSEIDAADPDNLKITIEVDGKALVLIMGDRHFLQRLENFLHHFPEIRSRLPQATQFDLRLDDRIVASHGEADGK